MARKQESKLQNVAHFLSLMFALSLKIRFLRRHDVRKHLKSMTLLLDSFSRIAKYMMTLNDPEWPFHVKFGFGDFAFVDNCVKTTEQET